MFPGDASIPDCGVLSCVCRGGCSDGRGPVAVAEPPAQPPEAPPREAPASSDESLRVRGANDLGCAVDQVRTQTIPGYGGNVMYTVDGCGHRAVYAPMLKWPGPVEADLVLVSRFQL